MNYHRVIKVDMSKVRDIVAMPQKEASDFKFDRHYAGSEVLLVPFKRISDSEWRVASQDEIHEIKDKYILKDNVYYVKPQIRFLLIEHYGLNETFIMFDSDEDLETEYKRVVKRFKFGFIDSIYYERFD